TAKMNPANPDTCWRNCGTDLGTHTHIFWSCPKISSFWDDVFTALNDVFKQPLARIPELALLGIIPNHFLKKNSSFHLSVFLDSCEVPDQKLFKKNH
uniref:Uncharacterized protein n=1 Tax=Oryzias melastigma TaxID=30732 RepID=A0A3B3CV34_ORYME